MKPWLSASVTSMGEPVRALTRRPEVAALPANVEVVAGDLTVPESLDAALSDVGAVFLVWTVPRLRTAAGQADADPPQRDGLG